MALVAYKDCENNISPIAIAGSPCDTPTQQRLSDIHLTTPLQGSTAVKVGVVLAGIAAALVVLSVKAQNQQDHADHRNHVYLKALCDSLFNEGKLNVYNAVYQEGTTDYMREIATKLENDDVFRAETAGRCFLTPIK